MRRVLVLASFLLAVPGTATAQDEPRAQQLCVTVFAPVPEEGWQASTLRDALADESASLTAVVDVASCREEPQSVDVPEGGPQPVEIVDQGFTAFPRRDDDYVTYAVILENPNEAGWVASSMEVIIDFLDDGGGVVSTTTDYITLVPGQTSAIVGTEFDAGSTQRIEVSVSNSEDDWEEIDFQAGEVLFSEVRTRRQRGDTVTTGRATSAFIERQEDIEVIVVYRDADGRIVGGERDFIAFLDPEARRPFKIETFDDLGPVGETEVYWEL